MGMFCEKRLYNVEAVERAALDVQVIGVDFPTVPFISGEVEELEYVSPRLWERKRLEAMAKRARALNEVQKAARSKATPYRTRPRKLSKGGERMQVPPTIEKASERNLLKCKRVSLTIQKERESLTTPMQRNPRLSTPSRRDRERPFSSMASLGGGSPNLASASGRGEPIPAVNLQIERNGSGSGASGGPGSPGSPGRGKPRSQSAKPSGHIFANLPKLKKNPQKTSQKTYKTRTSQYAERVKAVRKLHVQAQNEFSARLSCLNISIDQHHAPPHGHHAHHHTHHGHASPRGGHGPQQEAASAAAASDAPHHAHHHQQYVNA